MEIYESTWENSVWYILGLDGPVPEKADEWVRERFGGVMHSRFGKRSYFSSHDTLRPKYMFRSDADRTMFMLRWL